MTDPTDAQLTADLAPLATVIRTTLLTTPVTLGQEPATVRNTIARLRRRYGATDLHHLVQIHTTQQEASR